MKLNKVLRSAAAVTLALSTQAFAGDRIVGGEKVRAGDPITSSTLLIFGEISASQQYICTGSLIARDMIVTAAHCVAASLKTPTNPANMRVIFGLSMPMSASAAKQTPMVPVSNYKFDPGWKGAAAEEASTSSKADTHDIAVIHFNGELPEGYAPATLLDPSVVLKPGTDVTLAGYGIDETVQGPGQQGAGTLRKAVGVPVAQILSQSEVLLDQKGGVGACEGDSGGPAFLSVNGKEYLWGVANAVIDQSKARRCAGASIYARISGYSDFINQAEDSLRSQAGNAAAASAMEQRGLDRQRQANERALRVAGAMGVALSAE